MQIQIRCSSGAYISPVQHRFIKLSLSEIGVGAPSRVGDMIQSSQAYLEAETAGGESCCMCERLQTTLFGTDENTEADATHDGIAECPSHKYCTLDQIRIPEGLLKQPIVRPL